MHGFFFTVRVYILWVSIPLDLQNIQVMLTTGFLVHGPQALDENLFATLFSHSDYEKKPLGWSSAVTGVLENENITRAPEVWPTALLLVTSPPQDPVRAV